MAVPETRSYFSGGRMRPRYPFWPTPRSKLMDYAFAVRSWCVSLMTAYSGLSECLGSEGAGNPYTVASTDAAVIMVSTQTVEVIGTLLLAIKRKGVFRIQTPALEYGGCLKDYST